MPLEHGEDHRQPAGVHAAGGTARVVQRARRHQALHLDGERAPPLQRHRDARAGDPRARVGQEQPGRVRQPDDPVLRQVEAAHLVRGAVPVLHRTDHAQAGVPVALELADHVHQVLERAGAGHGAVLGHVPHEDRGDLPLLGHGDQRCRDLPDLRDAARGPVHLRGRDGLHRVDDEHVGLVRLQVAEHRTQVGLGREQQRGRQRADPLGPQPHLAGRLLARHVQHGAGRLEPVGAQCAVGHVARDREQQGRLAHARLTGEQDHRAGHQAAAEDAVELAHARRVGARGLHVDLGDGARRRPRRGHGGRAGAGRGSSVLYYRAPLLALPAAADPLDGGPAALGAPVRGPGLLGGR